MTEPSSVSLDEVRERFLEAEARLGDAAKAIQAIEDAATRVGAARESLTSAGEEIRGLAGQFSEVAASLGANAEELRRGVDAIRLGDPAAVRREIEELDAAFTAFQSVVGERFDANESAQTERSTRSETLSRSLRLELRVFGALTVALLLATLLLVFLR